MSGESRKYSTLGEELPTKELATRIFSQLLILGLLVFVGYMVFHKKSEEEETKRRR